MNSAMKYLGWMLLMAVAVSAQAGPAARPMRYLVFDWNAAGEPVLRFHSIVAAGETRVATAQLNAGRSDITVKIKHADSDMVATDMVAMGVASNAILHVPAAMNGHLDTHIVSAAPRAFVVRSAIADDDQLELQHQGRTFRFDLKTAQPAPELQKLLSSATVTKAATPANRVDVLIVGEGYTAAQRARFDADVTSFEQKFFAVSPYREYRNFITVSRLFAASPQSGADHPRYRADCAGGGPACCSDTDARNDPTAGTLVNTAFDGTYCTANIHRLLTVDHGKVLAAAAAAPEWDYIFVLVNDTVYGGSGGGFSVSSTGAGSDSIVVHEYAHSFTQLADEYDTPYPGYPSCSDLDVVGAQTCEANVTDDTRRHRIKWRHFVDAQTPLPTPLGTAGVGLFEGARYQSSGIFRPRGSDCLMRTIAPTFCPVCTESYVLRLYNGGWGAPSAGISLIEPGSEVPATGTTIDLATSGERVLRAELLRPEHALEVFWRVNGKRVEGIDVPQLNLDSLSLQPGLNRIELRVVDPNAAVRSGKAGAMAQQRVWQVAAGSGGTLVNAMGLTGLWYEPATSGQGVNLVFLDERHFILTFYGFEQDGDRLWLVADYSGTIAYDALLHFDLIEARGGVFENLDPAAIRRTVWGSGQLRFIDCDHAELQMTGTDGTQTLDMVKIVGVARLSCSAPM
jgi:hypothetical protein